MLSNPTATLVHINAVELNDALRRVKRHASSEETSYYLCGVYMHFDATAKAICFVATDGRRMAVVSVKTDDDLRAMPGVILPLDFVAAAIKATSKRAQRHYDAPMRVLAGKVTLCPYGQPEIECVPVDGTFPDYLRVIPRGHTRVATVDREAFCKAIAACTGFLAGASDSHRGLKLDFKDDVLTISATHDVGNATATLKLDESVEPICLVFNGACISSIVDSFEGKTIQLKLTDPGSPAIIVGCEHMDGHALHVLMPMRV